MNTADSIFEWRKLQSIEELQVKYEMEKSKNAMEILQKESTEQKLLALQSRTIFIVVIAIVTTVIIGVIFYFRKREKYLDKIKSLEAIQLVQEEKERIKQELHDSLGGQLSSISMGLNRLDKGQGNLVIENILGITERAIAELRDSLWIMDKEPISIGEIEQRVNNLFWQYRKMEVPITFSLSLADALLPLSLKASLAGNLFRIIQEATHNCVKHSQCSKFEIRMEASENDLCVTIADDGIGFDLTDPHGIEHRGLRNINARVQQIKAKFFIETSIGQGVKMLLCLPFATDNYCRVK